MFPAKILQLNEMLNGPQLSMNRVHEVRDETVNSLPLPSAIINAADEATAAQKRQRMQTTGVPCSRILAEVSITNKLCG